MRKLIVVILAVVLMATTANAVTVRELADSKLEMSQKNVIVTMLANGKQAAADSAFNLAMVEVTKAEAQAELKKMQQKAAAEFKAKVIAYVRPIHSIPAVLDSMPSFFKTNKLGLEEQWEAIELLSERYELGCGSQKLSPDQRLNMMKANYTNVQQFKADVREEIAHSDAIRQLSTTQRNLTQGYIGFNADINNLNAKVNDLTGRMTAAEAEIDTLNAGLAAVQTAVTENGFDIRAAMSVLRHARVTDKPNQAAQKLISQYGRHQN